MTRPAYSFYDEADAHRSMARYCISHGWRKDAKEWLRLARAAEASAREAVDDDEDDDCPRCMGGFCRVCTGVVFREVF